MSSDQILIPKSRIAVLIGEKGKDRKLIERLGKVKLWIDSKEGLVTVRGKAVDIWLAVKVVEAISRGFSPKNATLLFKEGYAFEKINLKAKTKKHQSTMKSRVIGTGGKIKSLIEQKTNTLIAIQGKTICILGKSEDVMLARQTIERIIEGSRQGSALKYLSDKQKS
jgi:ribosomal RNA assembly protein